MNRKQLFWLLGLLVVLGGAASLLHRSDAARQRSGHAAIGARLLGDFPVNDVAQITLRQLTNELHLIRKDGVWRIRERHDYPADFSRIRGFLLKVRDLKVIQSEAVGASQLPRLQLAPPGQGTNSALVIEFLGADDRVLRTLLLGKLHLRTSRAASSFDQGGGDWPDGRYVMTAGSPNVAVIPDTLQEAEPDPRPWLDKDFIRVEKARTVEVMFPDSTNSWKLTRDTEAGAWSLLGAQPGEQLDLSKLSGLSSPLNSASFTDVQPLPTSPATGTNRFTRVKIGTFDDFDYTLDLGPKTNEDYPVQLTVTARIPKERVPGTDEKAEDKARLDREFHDKQQTLEAKLKREQAFERWTYLVSGWTLDPILQERARLLAGKKTEPGRDGVPATPEGDGEGATVPAGAAVEPSGSTK
jgi:hypothetical protein